ncbi:MAG: alpha-galactosidase, partial [Chitinophagaceae bacterium]
TSRAFYNDQLGKGARHILRGESSNHIIKVLNVDIYDAYPSAALFSVTYKNNSDAPLNVKKWVNHHYQFTSDVKSGSKFWSFQGASYADRRDWLVPLNAGFYQQNYMGMNSSDYGSGTPVVDVWLPHGGLAIGHLETKPKLVSLPVDYRQKKNGLQINIEYDRPVILAPQQTLTSFRTFINAHKGDYFSSLVTYRHMMSAFGLAPQKYPESTYEPSWCAWGYERDFKIQDMIETLPKARELGFKWAVLDDGWQIAEGDWRLNKEKFPNGDKDMRALVSRIKDAGMHPRIWWAPLAADPGTPIFENEKDALLLDKDGKPVLITWWNSYYLCPAYLKNQSLSKDLVKKMIGDWGYEGLKIDGQHLNGVPQCFNPAHNHEHPEDSVESLQEFWKMIYETATSINKDAVVEICPCGDSYSYFNVPFMNQAVASDPLSSWQIRLKGKTLKALMGESSPYSGDHVELSDHKNDFASSVGIGA